MTFAIEMEINCREKEFSIFRSEMFSSTIRGTSGIFTKTLERSLSSADKNLCFFVKKSGFQILNILSLGARDVLNVPAKQQVGLRNDGRQLSIIG